MSSGSPPTLWWLLITSAVPSLPPLSIRSGYSVPCTRNSASVRPPVFSSKMRTNSSPIALRLASGSVTPGERVEEAVAGVDVDQLDAHVAPEGLDDLLALVLAHQPGVDVDARELWPIARWTSAAATDESTPPDSAQIARASPTWARMRGDLLVDDRAIVHVGSQPARSWRNARSTAMPCACARPRGGTARPRSGARRPRARPPAHRWSMRWRGTRRAPR